MDCTSLETVESVQLSVRNLQGALLIDNQMLARSTPMASIKAQLLHGKELAVPPVDVALLHGGCEVSDSEHFQASWGDSVELEAIFVRQELSDEEREQHCSYYQSQEYTTWQTYADLPEKARADEKVTVLALERVFSRPDFFKILNIAHTNLKAHKEFMMFAVCMNGRALKLAHESLKMDEEITEAAVQQSPAAVQYADKSCQLRLVMRNTEDLRWADPSLRADKAFMSSVVRKQPTMLKFASAALREDKDLVMLAVQENGFTLVLAAKSLQTDAELLFTALVGLNGHSGQFLHRMGLSNIIQIMMNTQKLSFEEADAHLSHILRCSLDGLKGSTPDGSHQQIQVDQCSIRGSGTESVGDAPEPISREQRSRWKKHLRNMRRKLHYQDRTGQVRSLQLKSGHSRSQVLQAAREVMRLLSGLLLESEQH